MKKDKIIFPNGEITEIDISESQDVLRDWRPVKSFDEKLADVLMIVAVIIVVLSGILLIDSFLSHRFSINYIQKVEASGVPEVYYTKVTGYNLVQEQTDDTPCISASGDNICGRKDVVAWPREIGFGTKVEIDGKIYECLDRLAKKYDDRFDISCDDDFECPNKITGFKRVLIIK